MARSTGPTKTTVEKVWERDGGACAGCGRTLRFEDRGSPFGWSMHHRLPRGAGGTRAPWINLPSNLVCLCGSGTTGCHGDKEGHRRQAEDDGFIIRRGIRKPIEIPVTHFRHGHVYLTDDGRAVPVGSETPF